MLYLIAHYFEFEGIANLIRYQTFRAGAALMTALVIGLLIGPRFIVMLRMRQGKGQPIREDGPQSHFAKRGTPTMGGLMILVSLITSMLLWMDLSSPLVWACLAVTIGFGLIGFLDDYDKVRKSTVAGVPGRVRLAAEFLVAGVASWILVSQVDTNLYVPFFSDRFIPLGPFYYVFAAFVIVGAGNAVNLTDGLDGLATMPVIIAAGTFAITDTASITNSPPTIASTISCCAATEIAPSAPPSARLPVSPMNTAAGGALNHRKASPAPMIPAHRIASSPARGTCGIPR